MTFSAKNCLSIAILMELAFITYTVVFFTNHTYLPSPFFSDVHDTWMDFFHINFIALRNESYAVSKSIYSTINLYIAKILVSGSCINSSDAFDLRKCDVKMALIWFFSMLMLNFLLLLRIMRTVKNKWLWAFVMTCSFPMLYGFERGNYIFLAMLGISLCVLANHVYLKAAILAIPIAFKFYLAIFLAPIMLRYRHWHVFLIAGLVIVINFVFGLLLQTNDWYLIVKNILSFGAAKPPLLWVVESYPSIMNFLRVFQAFQLDNSLLVLTYLIQSILVFMIITRTILFLGLASKNKVDIHHMLLVTLLAYLLLSNKAGYYSFILIFPFVAYCLSKNAMSNRAQVYFVLSILPYPLKIISLGSVVYEPAFATHSVLLLNSLSANHFLPAIFLFLLFYELTSHIYLQGDTIEHL